MHINEKLKKTAQEIRKNGIKKEEKYPSFEKIASVKLAMSLALLQNIGA